MLQELVAAVKASYSGVAARQQVAAISQFHRIQASPGYRAAAEYCLGQLRSWGVPAEILSFPANEHTTYWAQHMFQEWDCTAATLDLLADGEVRRLADYREEKIAVIQRSGPFSGEAEVVLLDRGDGPEEYVGLDVAGKVVLAQGNIAEIYRLAVQERGAVGVLYDGMRDVPPVRQRIDLPDTCQYTSFWYYEPGVPHPFGFVLTPRQGDELRWLARSGNTLQVRAHVESRLYDGAIEVVSALIPGETDEEAVVVAHLCHPQPSANDNASGAGAALEAAHALQCAIAAGRLPRPRRGIRFLWVPEMTGTFAYLATHEDEIARMVAGINLDMVGQNQEACGSVFLIERPPDAMASFAADLAEALRELLQEGASSHSDMGSFLLYRQAVTPFSGGSDHYILSDPTVGVPTPMLIQWPDRFYHTSADTIDKVDAGMLAVVGGLAAAYAYFVAAAGEREARWLAREMTARGKAVLQRIAQDGYTRALAAGSLAALGQAAQRTARDLGFRADRLVAGLGSLARLDGGLAGVIAAQTRELRAAQAQEWAAVEPELTRLARRCGAERLPAPVGPVEDEWLSRARGLVYRRAVRGPVGDLSLLMATEDRATLRDLVAGHGGQSMVPVSALYWLDGQRSLAQVADLVECEIGERDVEFLVRLAELLEHARIVQRV
jgi:aminopeptidase YwaD